MSRQVTPKSANRSRVPGVPATNKEDQQRSQASPKAKESSTVAKGLASREQSPITSASSVKSGQVSGSKGLAAGRGRAKDGGAEESDLLPTSGAKSGTTDQVRQRSQASPKAKEKTTVAKGLTSRKQSPITSASSVKSGQVSGSKSLAAVRVRAKDAGAKSGTTDQFKGSDDEKLTSMLTGLRLEGSKSNSEGIKDQETTVKGKEETEGVKVKHDEDEQMVYECEVENSLHSSDLTKPFPVMKTYSKYFCQEECDFYSLFKPPLLLSEAERIEECFCYNLRIKMNFGSTSTTTPKMSTPTTQDTATPKSQMIKSASEKKQSTPLPTTFSTAVATHYLALGTEFVPCFVGDEECFETFDSGNRKLITALNDCIKNVIFVPSFERSNLITTKLFFNCTSDKVLVAPLSSPEKSDLVIFVVREAQMSEYVIKIKELDGIMKKQVACFALPPGQNGPGHCKYWSVEIGKKFSLGWFALMDDSVYETKVGRSRNEYRDVTVYKILTLIRNAPALNRRCTGMHEKIVCVGGNTNGVANLENKFMHARVNQLLFLNGSILRSLQIKFSPLAPLVEEMLFEYKCLSIGLLIIKARWLAVFTAREQTGGMHSPSTHSRDNASILVLQDEEFLSKEEGQLCPRLNFEVDENN